MSQESSGSSLDTTQHSCAGLQRQLTLGVANQLLNKYGLYSLYIIYDEYMSTAVAVEEIRFNKSIKHAT